MNRNIGLAFHVTSIFAIFSRMPIRDKNAYFSVLKFRIGFVGACYCFTSTCSKLQELCRTSFGKWRNFERRLRQKVRKL